ncbi:MAG: MOSC domain-containing protein [Planctomycetota bacterium]|nr:MOSC domain-containing protein [Planctomycetota bacterium]
MQLISVNAGRPRYMQFQGKSFRTAIYKTPVSGTVPVRSLQIEGDGQADLQSHGGTDKAVYLYPLEHYDFWRTELGLSLEQMGSFGENFTSEGMLESEVCIGDTFEVGTAVVQVSQPRTPCYKLAARLERPDLPARFLKSLKSGFYLRVLTEGQVQAGDCFVLRDRDSEPVTVQDLVRIYHFQRDDEALIHRVLKNGAIAREWRCELQRRLDERGFE